MNCANFETIVNELAENRPMDATARVNGLAHVTICAECAMRLNDARNIATGLQLALAAESEAAPARVRESLLAAFAEQHHATVAPIVPISSSKGSSWRTIRWWSAAAIAAAAAIVLALLLPSLVRVMSPALPSQTANVNQASPQTLPSPKATVLPKAAAKQPEEQPANVPGTNPVLANNRLPVGPAKRSRLARAAPFANSSKQVDGEVAANKAGRPGEYFPLTYLASATAMESGTVVRIQVSRSKLISLGLPMDGDRANELVKADLVLGDDGVARAIRLVE